MLYDDLAQKLFGAKRAESNAVLTDATTGTIHGRALTDSADGSVVVEITGDVTNPDPVEIDGEVYYGDADTGIEIPTSENVKAGDEVLVSVYGEGTMRSPAVTSAIGSGDRVAAKADEAWTKADSVEGIAQQALDIAEATGQYFWHDDAGAHVSTEALDPEGDQNVLLNAVGMVFRAAANNILALVTGQTPGMAIYDGLGNAADNIIASFTGSGQRIGRADEAHLFADFNSLQLIDKGDDKFFTVEDLRDDTGYAEIVDTFTGDGTNKTFKVSNSVSSVVSVTVAGATTTAYTRDGVTFTFNSAPASGAEVVITYLTDSATAKAFTFGSRSGNTGALSCAIGEGVEASGGRSNATGQLTKATAPASHSEGILSTASGGASHAEGQSTVASGADSHAEGTLSQAIGFSSHAEGQNTYAYGPNSHAEGQIAMARGLNSHAEGYYTTALGENSHAGGRSATATGNQGFSHGYGTRASSDNQTAIGTYNIEDGSDVYAFIIGNGDSNTRSNAFAIKWDGSMQIASQDFAAADVIAALTKDHGTITMTGASTTRAHECFRRGWTIQCNITTFHLNAALATGRNVVIGTIPAGFRPSVGTFEAPYCNNATYAGRVFVSAGTDGNIVLFNFSGSSLPTSVTFTASFTYIVN